MLQVITAVAGVQASWQRPLSIPGKLLGYRLVYRLIGGDFQKTVPIDSASDDSYVADSLRLFFVHVSTRHDRSFLIDTGATYEFKLYAKNEIGFGLPTIQNITMPPGGL